MNVKNIIKVVALAMLMPAMMLNSACSNEDEPVIDNENAPSRGYPLYVSVNATRQGDAGTNRASFDGTYLHFTAGDKLFVKGEHVGEPSNHFAGLLNYDDVSGKFSGTIYTELGYSGTPEELFGATMTSVTAYLIPNGYGKYFDLENCYGNRYNDIITFEYPYAFAETKAAGVEQLSYEHGGYDKTNKRFVLNPFNAILNFTITGFAASSDVEMVFNDGTTLVNHRMSTNASGTATFAIGVPGYVESHSAGTNLNTCTLSVGGNAITLVSSSKVLTAGKIYNITRAVTPPTLAQTMTTAGMTVKVKYNYEDEVNYCLFSSNGDDTYTFQSGDGYAGSDNNMAKALVVEGGKLVFKQNFFNPIDQLWSDYGFSVTFYSDNSYSQWIPDTEYGSKSHNPSFISVEVNSVPIALTKKITVSDLVKENYQSWSNIISNNSDKIKDEGGYVVRISDDAKLQYSMGGDDWHYVMYSDSYQPMYNTYKFEGD